MGEMKGKKVPIKGTSVPAEYWRTPTGKLYAAEISRALRKDLGYTHGAAKKVMRWTGASERTVKHWFAGSRGPGGLHLVCLIRNSEAVFQCFLNLSGRQSSIAAYNVREARKMLSDALMALGPD